MHPCAQGIADFLTDTEGISKRRLGEFFGRPSTFANGVLEAFLRRVFKDNKIEPDLVPSRTTTVLHSQDTPRKESTAGPADAAQPHRQRTSSEAIDARILLDGALRSMLVRFRLPGEAQQIDRIMETFARCFAEAVPEAFQNQDTAYVLAFSLIMLNTDLHSTNIGSKNRMSVEDFISNNRGISNGNDIPDHVLRALYASIKVWI